MARTQFRIGRALRYRNFRLFFFGQGTSLIGTWLTKFASSYLAYKLTGSAFMLGLVAFASSAPTPVFAPIAGVLVDRMNRQRVIILTQIAAGLQSAALAVFAITGMLNVWHLMWLGALQGFINAFDMPARQAFLREMIDDKVDLPNAIALTSSMVNVAKMIGPAIGAALVVVVGEGWCYAIDAASYIAVIGSLLAIKVKHPTPPIERAPVRQQLAAGFRYVRSQPMIRAVLLLLLVVGILAGGYLQLLPAVAAEQVGYGPRTLGILMTSGGLGALCGALYLANRNSVLGLDGVIWRASLILGIALAGLESTSSMWSAAPVIFVIGGMMMVQMAATNTIVQTVTEPAMLGRVMALYAAAWTGGMPIGALLEGALASQFGAVHTLAAAGVLLIVAVSIYRHALPRLRPTLRIRYRELGILAPLEDL